MTTDAGAVLVTGTSSGIGRASARALVRAGFRVFAGVRREQSLRELTLEDPELCPVLLDVTDAKSIAKACSQVKDSLAGQSLRAIINNAGVSRCGPLELIERGDIEEVVNVNLLAPLWVTRAFLPLLDANGGRIINIGSGEGFIVLPMNGAYAIAKRGLEALSDALRLEIAIVGHHVSVVVPGGVSTRIQERGLARFRQLADQTGPMQLYRDAILGRARIAERGLRGTGPERTAATVVRAVTADRPKPHYYVSWDAWLPALLARLPSRVRDIILRHAVA